MRMKWRILCCIPVLNVRTILTMTSIVLCVIKCRKNLLQFEIMGGMISANDEM